MVSIVISLMDPREGRAQRYEVRMRHQDGSDLWVGGLSRPGAPDGAGSRKAKPARPAGVPSKGAGSSFAPVIAGEIHFSFR